MFLKSSLLRFHHTDQGQMNGLTFSYQTIILNNLHQTSSNNSTLDCYSDLSWNQPATHQLYPTTVTTHQLYPTTVTTHQLYPTTVTTHQLYPTTVTTHQLYPTTVTTHQLYPTTVNAVAIFVEDGLEDITDGTIGLGLDPDRLVVGEIQSKQDATLDHHFFGPQCRNVFLQVEGLWASKQCS